LVAIRPALLCQTHFTRSRGRSTFPWYHTNSDTVAEIDILSPEFTREAEAAWDRARNQALALTQDCRDSAN
jgi:hypothetical protein